MSISRVDVVSVAMQQCQRLQQRLASDSVAWNRQEDDVIELLIHHVQNRSYHPGFS